MAYRLQLDPEKPIIHSWISKDFDLQDEFRMYLTELGSILDRMDCPTIFLTDLSLFAATFADVTHVLGIMTRGDLAVLNHPRLHKTIVISENRLVGFGTSALGQNQYGSLRAQVVRSEEEGLAAADQELALIAQKR